MTTGADAQVSPQLRRERRGWYFYDFATSVFSTSVVTVFLAPYLTEIAEAAKFIPLNDEQTSETESRLDSLGA